MPAPPSPARRVLGDKTPNASMKRRAPEPMPKSYLDYSISEEVKALTKHSVEMEVELITTSKAGQKRKIQEVDGTEEQAQQRTDRAGSTSPLTVLPTQPNSETDEGESLSTGQTKTTASTLLTSFHASEEPLMPPEDQFDIQDEMSQRTLDKIHATPIPDHTSQLQPPLQPSLATETSQDSVRMSSFIDFESNEPEDDLRMIPAESTKFPKHRLGKEAVEEKAETLRTRLQLAIYKVQTNQISKPFSRLKQPRTSSPELPPQPPSLRRTSPEGIVAAARARATQQRKPAVRDLNSLPIPKIVPTAYSARYMRIEEERARPQLSTPLSSCMEDDSSWEVRGLERSRIPTLSQEEETAFPKTPMQLSPLKHGQGKKLGSGLTSSVVKGQAANGLLELMRAAAA